MSTYCESSSKGLVTIKVGNEVFQVISNKPPITVNIINSGIQQTIYSHSMNVPIDKDFDYPVSSLSLSPPGQTYNNGAVVNPIRACPMPLVNGKKIYSIFDDYYLDNTGSCRYEILFYAYELRVSDANGIIFSKAYNTQPEFTVSCGDECPPGYHKCTHNKYPGYCCIPCKETGDKLKNIAAKVAT